ncbi:MAG: GPW/gp25 family protein [Phycisphaerales bacterium]
MSDATYFDYPVQFDGAGRTTQNEYADHVHDLIRQVLFTIPGERVNRPDFGCGVKRLVFMPNSDALAAATKTQIQSALQKWLEGVIRVEKVDVSSDENRLDVSVQYVRLDDLSREHVIFRTEVES